MYEKKKRNKLIIFKKKINALLYLSMSEHKIFFHGLWNLYHFHPHSNNFVEERIYSCNVCSKRKVTEKEKETRKKRQQKIYKIPYFHISRKNCY